MSNLRNITHWKKAKRFYNSGWWRKVELCHEPLVYLFDRLHTFSLSSSVAAVNGLQLQSILNHQFILLCIISFRCCSVYCTFHHSAVCIYHPELHLFPSYTHGSVYTLCNPEKPLVCCTVVLEEWCSNLLFKFLLNQSWHNTGAKKRTEKKENWSRNR